MSTQKHLIVVGGGAAGFFCAVNAARHNPKLKVSILEKSSRVLQKVRVSGGGRCNVTHACFQPSEMIKRYPRGDKFLKKAFHDFFTTHTIEWFQQRGVKLKTEADGRMFPVTDSSETIIDCLVSEANRYGVQVLLNKDVTGIAKTEQGWSLQMRSGTGMEANFLCITCGGFPKAEQFEWITGATGHSVAAPVPSLFTFNLGKHPITQLMGVAVPKAQVKIAGTKLVSEGPLLITHWGVSGPAVLRLSAFAALELAEKKYNYTVVINWLPDFNENTLREKILQHRQVKGGQKVINTEWTGLPQRLWQFLLAESGITEEQRWNDCPAALQNKLIKNLCGQEFAANGKTTFKEEFVTAGGIQLAEVESHTMMSRLQPGLYFAGEILNVDGITGGFNFQNAWTTGFIAAKAIAVASAQ